MSYQVLARKYRPRNFAELVGQEHVARALGNALAHNRLHHAYLFTGTRGVGKTTIARILAKCLNCETGITAAPCGECVSCREIAEGRFIDLLEIDAASNTGVDDVREVIDNAQYVPTRGRYKVYLIDEVHMLSKSAFNALLKTLEEPPPHVKFLLATTDPQKVPVTVLSRCLQFALKPMSPERVVGHLRNVLEAEGIACDDGALWELGRAANGSMRDALSLTDQAIAYGNGALVDAEVREMLGSLDRDLVFRVLEAVQGGDAGQLLDVIEAMAAQSVDFAGAMTAIISALHRVALAQILPDAVDNSDGDRERVLELAGRLTAEDVQLYYQIALHGRRDLPLAPSLRQGFEMCLIRMLAFRPVPTGPGPASRADGDGRSRPVSRASSQGQGVQGTASHLAGDRTPASALPAAASIASRGATVARLAEALPVAEPAPQLMPVPDPETVATATILPFPSAPAPAPVAADPLAWSVESWAAWVQASELSGMALTLARHVLLLGRQDGESRMQVSPRHEIMAAQAYETLKARLAQDFPRMQLVRVTVEPEGQTPLELEQARQRAERAAAEADFLADGTVRALMAAFDARLLPESLIVGEKT